MKTANQELIERIKRFHAVNEQRKALEKEEEALRDWFKTKAKGKPVTFAFDDLEVPVTLEERVSIDNKALRLELGDKIAKFEKRTSFWKVAVRRVKTTEVLKAG